MPDPRPPSADEPMHVGPHRVFFLDDSIFVTIYVGDVTPGQIRQIIELLADRDPLTMSIIDVEQLGAFGPEARKMIAAPEVQTILGAEGREFVVFVCNANVAQRALMTLVGTAARLLSKRKIKLLFVRSLEEAVTLARARDDAPA